MKTKSFYDLIKTKLSQEQLDDIEKQAQHEVDIFRTIQAERANTKKTKSTVDELIESLSPEERENFYEEYKELLFSELILATEAKNTAEYMTPASSDTYETEKK